MIVEPVPTSPRSPLRRGLRIAGVVAPLVLLAAVVAAGALGPQRQTDTTDEAVSSGVPVDASGRPAGTVPPVVLARNPVAFPASWIGLPVRTVSATLAARGEGQAPGIVAVAGYLSYGSLDWSCADAYLDRDRSACGGRAVLAEQPVLPGAGGGIASIGPHLHPLFPAGTRGPAPGDAPGDPRAEPIPVVVLGSFDDPRIPTCDPGSRDCGQAFAVQRVVWVAGDVWQATLTVDPALDVDPNVPEVQRTVAAVRQRIGLGPLLLSVATVLPDALAAVDPAAAAALPPIPDRARLRAITYVRALVFTYDASQPLYGRDPAIGWLVVDSISGDLLAEGGALAGRLASGGVPAR